MAWGTFQSASGFSRSLASLRCFPRSASSCVSAAGTNGCLVSPTDVWVSSFKVGADGGPRRCSSHVYTSRAIMDAQRPNLRPRSALTSSVLELSTGNLVKLTTIYSHCAATDCVHAAPSGVGSVHTVTVTGWEDILGFGGVMLSWSMTMDYFTHATLCKR